MTQTEQHDAPAETAIELKEVWKSFGEQTVHCGVSLAVRRGELMTLVGGSGQGKSVLLREIIGLERPDRGEVVVDGTDVTRLSERRLVPVRRKVGMLFQSAALFDAMNVHDNIAYPLREHTLASEAEISRVVAEKLALVDLPGIEQKMPDELSGGMKKRVGLARALAMEPKVLLYDEPTTGLDPATARRICELIRRLQDQLHVTAVMVTHDLPFVRAITDRLAMLWQGRIIGVGTWDEMESAENPAIRQFLGEGVQRFCGNGSPTARSNA